VPVRARRLRHGLRLAHAPACAPVRYLKIDRSFVRDIATNRGDQAMVRGIVAIARELDMLTVAEGIEDAATLELVKEYGVDYVQGFHIGRPAPVG